MSEFFRKIHLNGQEVTVPTDSYGTPLITLDEEYVNKRKNRIIMEKQKQKRDSKGRFASNGAVAATDKPKVEKRKGKAKDVIDWKSAYDKKVIECNEAYERISEISTELHESQLQCEELSWCILKCEEKGKYWQSKARKYLDSTEKYERYCIELRKQVEWLRSHLSWFVKLRFFRVLSDMVAAYTNYRNAVAESLKKWQ